MTATQELVVPRSIPMIEEKFLLAWKRAAVFYFFSSWLSMVPIN